MADGAGTRTSGVLRRWGDVTLTARASGANRNEVWFAVVGLGDRLVAGRPGRPRSPDDPGDPGR